MSILSYHSLDERIERRLDRMATRFRWIRFGERTAVLGAVFFLALLALGVSARRGVLQHPAWAAVTVFLILMGTAVAFFLLVLLSGVQRVSREDLAAAVEEVHPQLLDRLNTLVHLETERDAPAVRPLFERIEEQAGDGVETAPGFDPYPRRGLSIRWALCAALAIGAFYFYARFQPWRELRYPDESVLEELPVMPPDSYDAAELEGPASDTAAPEPPWGEVRITEPGRDLKVTKVDVVPLQIEAAASEPLDRSQWFTAVGGDARLAHDLPPPSEPHYAVYRPLLYVDEFRLSDWDVLSYHAAAETEGGASYASEIYFLEIRPFREDILKLPGGEGGNVYRTLSELSGLIDRQKHVLRETHGFLQRTYEGDEERAQDLKKLVQAEQDLAEASRHLYARVAARFENQDVGSVLEHLARAEEVLRRTAGTLETSASEAPPVEQEALQELVATRKDLQKAVSENPGAFGEDGGESADEPSPIADLREFEGLKEIAEFRDEEKAVRDALEKAIDDQKRIVERTNRARSATPEERRELAAEQEEIRQRIAELGQTHPRLARIAREELATADAACRRAGGSIQDADGAAAREALESLESLARVWERGETGQKLADAYRLREAVDRQATELEDVESRPGEWGEEKTRQASSADKETTRALKELVEDPAMEGAFGLPLHEALSDRRQEAREKTLDELARAKDAEDRRHAASRARQSLEELSQAFDRSAPSLVQEIEGKDPLGSGGDDGLNEALRRLQSLLAQLESGRELAPEDESRLRREALAEMRLGLLRLEGESDRAANLLVRLKRALEDERPLEAAQLKRLLEEIEAFRVETSAERLEDSESNLRHIDPSSLPAAYRERIWKYFQKLSREP